MRRHREDITGRVFNKLTAVRFVGKDSNGNSLWYCTCECGGEKYTTLSNLKYNNTKSCGCDKREVIEKMAEARRKENSSLIFLYRKYKAGAKTRGYAFDLHLDEFGYLTSAPCSYCGAPPAQIIRTSGKQPVYTYNGIDRIDNSLGYTVDNCNPCCSICNWMKSDMPIAAFISHIEKIYTNLLVP